MEVPGVPVKRKLEGDASQKGYCVLGPVVRRREGNHCLPFFPERGDQLEFLGLRVALGQRLRWPLSGKECPGASVLVSLPTHPGSPGLISAGKECLFAVGAEVAVYKWTLGCDGDSRKQLGG